MTYKHISFNDSEIMRSLVKVAHNKGILKEDSDVERAVHAMHAMHAMRTHASDQKNKLDLSVTSNVKENLLKLCSGLRDKGFVSYASKVEQHIAQLHMIETALPVVSASDDVHMYNVHGESGEDLLEFAHPEGDPTVAPAEDENGKVRGQISTHKKILEIVNKNAEEGPRQKLEIIRAVQSALGVSQGKDLPLVRKAAGAPTREQSAAFSAIIDKVFNYLNQLVTALNKNELGFGREPFVKGQIHNIESMYMPALDMIKSEVAQGKTSTLIQVLNSIKQLRSEFYTSKQKSNPIFTNDDVSITAQGTIDSIIKNLENISWGVDHNWVPPVKIENEISFSNPGKWQQDVKINEAPVSVPKDNSNKVKSNLTDIKQVVGLCSKYASYIKEFILNKEDAIYGPIPDSDTAKLQKMDRVFDRATKVFNQLNNVVKSNSGLEAKINNEQDMNSILAPETNKMFQGRSFKTILELDQFLQQVYDVITTALKAALA